METMQIINIVFASVVAVLSFFAVLSLLTSLESIAKSLKQMSGRTDGKR